MHTCRVHTFTEKSENISSPVSYIPLIYLADDGSKVEKGAVIARFDREQSQYGLDSLKLEMKSVEGSLRYQLLRIGNKNQLMRDQLAELGDKLAVQAARRARYQRLPEADEVAIAEGRLRVSRLSFGAAEEDATKGRDRFARKMISRGELDGFESELAAKQANLDYAERSLAIARLPATASTIQICNLRIENLQLEMEKLSNEIEEHKAISEIQKKGAASRGELLGKRIEEAEESLANTEVVAPLSGYVSYRRSGWSEVIIGAKLRKNFTFMKIPDMDTLAFRGVILESMRRHFEVGDPATILVRGRGDVPVHGRIKSISTLPHDLAEKPEAEWGSQNRQYGVKVFDFVVSLDKPTDWLRPGMDGEVRLQAERQTDGPAVALRFVKWKGGKSYLAFDGIYQEVTGTVNQGLFILDDTGWARRTVTMRGDFEQQKGADDAGGDNLFSVSGELTPVNSIDIIVKNIGHWPWPKVKWLVDEETVVKKGDVVAKLDSEEIDKRLREDETRLSQRRSRMEELQKSKGLLLREGEFKLKTSRNLLEIARLELDTTLNGISSSGMNKANLDVATATVKLERVQRRLAREHKKKTTSLSPAELRKLKRDVERRKLNLEQTQIRLAKVEEGATAVAKSKAQLDYMNQQMRLRVLEKTTEYNNDKMGREYRRAELDVKRYQARVDRRLRRKGNMTVTSPADGLISYGKIWSNGMLAKLAVGSVVGPRFMLMSIPDLGEMVVSVDVPEKYFTQVKEGLAVDVRIPSLLDEPLKGKVENLGLIFRNRKKKDSQVGLYSSQEPLGEVVFTVQVKIASAKIALKPGALADVFFPFEKDGP